MEKKWWEISFEKFSETSLAAGASYGEGGFEPSIQTIVVVDQHKRNENPFTTSSQKKKDTDFKELITLVSRMLTLSRR